MLKVPIESVLRVTRRSLLVLAVAASAFSVDAAAQCAKPDGLDGGPCCAVAQPSFPTVPKFKQDSLGICWRDCNVESTIKYRAVWSPYLSGGPGTLCQPVFKRLRLIDSSTGALAWSGVMRQQYSRTWEETDPAGVQHQVWRYLVNGDLQPTAGVGTIPCPIPPCAPAFNNRVRFTGYVDLARICGAPGSAPSEYAWMLTHTCDLVDHAPGFPRAGPFHPDRSYSFVGPSAGFVPGPIAPIEAGSGAFEALRRVFTGGGLGFQCQFEEQIDFFLQPIQDLCLCGSPTAQPQFTLSNLGVAGVCGSAITTTGGPFLPGYMTMSIGRWTLPGSYPGQETLRWNCGGYDYAEACVGTTRKEVFFGVTTLGGWPARQVLSSGPGLTLPLTFVDQSNSLRGNLTLMNLPFVSDHFINLNM